MTNYFKFWQITGPVFVRPADTSALFKSSHIATLTKGMLQFAETAQPLALLTGEGGSGKTTLLRWLADHLPMATHDVFLTTLLHRETAAGWFLPRLADYFQADTSGSKNWQKKILTGLNQLTEEGRHLLLCIDASHLICSEEAMSDLEAFFNLQDHTQLRVSLLMAATPEFSTRVRSNASLSVRTSAHFETKSLERSELEGYVAHGSERAGISAGFDHDALTTVYKHSNGNLMQTAMLLEKCLIEAAARDSRRVSNYIAEHAAGSLTGKSPASLAASLPKAAAAGEKPTKAATPPKATEHITPKAVAGGQHPGKNEKESLESIKLSSLFKQDDE